MFTNQFFIISSLGHEIILWVLFILSILSIGILLERFFFLRQWKKSSALACKEIKQAIETGQPEWIKNLHLTFSNIDKNANTQFLSAYLEKKSPSSPSGFPIFYLFSKNPIRSPLKLFSHHRFECSLYRSFRNHLWSDRSF